MPTLVLTTIHFHHDAYLNVFYFLATLKPPQYGVTNASTLSDVARKQKLNMLLTERTLCRNNTN